MPKIRTRVGAIVKKNVTKKMQRKNAKNQIKTFRQAPKRKKNINKDHLSYTVLLPDKLSEGNQHNKVDFGRDPFHLMLGTEGRIA